jgi:fatty-acyl-CoA synthase
VTPAPPEAAFEAILMLVKERGWKIVTDDTDAGRIEATETSFWFDFKDDVMIRIQPTDEGGSRIDVRSASRVGLSDLGANAKRVRNLLDDIEIALH